MTSELPAIPGGWTNRDFVLPTRNATSRSPPGQNSNGVTLKVTLPASPDAFLDDPEVLAANRQNDYMPYWSYVWPTSLETAVAVLDYDWPAGTEALEIGAGIALTGLAALSRGLAVTFSDYDQRAIDLALVNARQNKIEQRAEGLLMDWRAPIDRQFPVIFGCDVIYERQNHQPILGVLQKMLAKTGQAWISDPGRFHAGAFLDLLADSPFEARQRLLAREPYPGRPDGTTNLWIVTWKA